MKTFIQFISEEEVGRSAFVAYGRHQPFTEEGHGKVLKTLESGAEKEGAEAHFITSHSEGTSSNPLPSAFKVKLIKKVAKPTTKVYASNSESPSLLHQLTKIHDSGVQHVTYVGGSDRVGPMTDLIKKYNGVKGSHGYFNFKSINSKSSGERDPDAEGSAGVSGTKVRAMAHAGDTQGLKKAIPKEHHPHVKEIIGHIQSQSIKEDTDIENTDF